MNSTDRFTVATTAAVILYLILVLGLSEQLDCPREQISQRRFETSHRLVCETTGEPVQTAADVNDTVHEVQHTAQLQPGMVLRCERDVP